MTAPPFEPPEELVGAIALDLRWRYRQDDTDEGIVEGVAHMLRALGPAIIDAGLKQRQERGE